MYSDCLHGEGGADFLTLYDGVGMVDWNTHPRGLPEEMSMTDDGVGFEPFGFGNVTGFDNSAIADGAAADSDGDGLIGAADIGWSLIADDQVFQGNASEFN